MKQAEDKSGIRLPGDAPLALTRVCNGGWVVENCYVVDAGYFASSELYKKRPNLNKQEEAK